jgi:hypothetical protein
MTFFSNGSDRLIVSFRSTALTGARNQGIILGKITAVSNFFGAPMDFRNPVNYTVTARDGSTATRGVSVSRTAGRLQLLILKMSQAKQR